ncbi:Sll0314/Alr1548 family TPR repeat-containing protein [Leptolyngbya sp. AN02str]|uniref:Sll0314/Alr1548 family TPR repeat-containing protein n=1 Tax=Leptolyngbya sp. AN02str TaxID=3423363 RepID=UPI003D3177DD
MNFSRSNPIHAGSCSSAKTLRARWYTAKRAVTTLTGSVAITLSLLAAAGLADPFRSSAPRQVDSQAEAAFEAMFRDGDYVQAAEFLNSASADEPLTHGLRASIAYLNGDKSQLGEYARLTLESAERLAQRDPLRGNIYLAGGHFLEGGYLIETQGLVAATPRVLGKLQQVFDHLRQAEAIDAADPELNLLRGFMDLMLAVNLPFSNPAQAIERFQTNAGPSYLVNRGVAIAYRDLNQPEQALQAVNQALEETPDNPELLYLKAQILVKQGKDQESTTFFGQALEQVSQLPLNVRMRLAWESCRTNSRINQLTDQQSRTECQAAQQAVANL